MKIKSGLTLTIHPVGVLCVREKQADTLYSSVYNFTTTTSINTFKHCNIDLIVLYTCSRLF